MVRGLHRSYVDPLQFTAIHSYLNGMSTWCEPEGEEEFACPDLDSNGMKQVHTRLINSVEKSRRESSTVHSAISTPAMRKTALDSKRQTLLQTKVITGALCSVSFENLSRSIWNTAKPMRRNVWSLILCNTRPRPRPRPAYQIGSQ